MAQRLELHEILINLLGSNNVYFQPPPSLSMNYPCIVYKRDDVNTEYADNKSYKNKKRYQITVIDANPDSLIPESVEKLPMCSYDRFFSADNLNHDVFNLYF